MIKKTIWQQLNITYAAILMIAGVVWCLQLHTFGISCGLVAMVIAVFFYQQKRWAYFAAAVWCFGMLRIAMDDGYDFYQGYQSYVKVPYLVLIVLAIILHEKLTKAPKDESEPLL